ncbi:MULTISPECIES: hypothetical protein [Halorussus]|uniref:hypothetical protein n=1 Tax=Halorussus TaxID=1070314 RepID=UPI0013B38FE2|nr:MULTISPECIES: hypothetical protein [Halorussus]NHN59695.1 hypothetical protein [Halorussus sp. JP-T4]
MSKIVVLLAELVLVLGIAAVVGTLARRVRIPFTVILVPVGFAISVSYESGRGKALNDSSTGENGSYTDW